MIQLHDKTFEAFIPEQEINFAIQNVAKQIEDDFYDEVPVFIGVLNGAFMFLSDLMKHYSRPCEVSFIKMASYEGTASTNDVKQLIGLNQDLEGRSVVIVEDIVDTGNTVEELKKIFKAQGVKHFRIATLFFKPQAYTKDIKIDYIGIRIPNKFIVGFGLDYDGLGRNLKEVYQLSNTHNKMINIVLFGKPGAGKGTQAEVLKQKYNLVHLSTGDIFRFNIKNETELGKLAKTYIDKGDLVPDEVTIKMLQDEVEKNPEAKGFLFDGFPRTITQAGALDTFLHSKNWEVTATVALEADDEILVQRLLERGKTSGRVDDQDVDKIRNRYDEYNQKTAPLMDYYKKQDKFKAVDGIGGIDEISERLFTVVDSL
ncbi:MULTISPECIES: adenylate kinase [Flavobacterium]|uniref:Adenylate kinase n=1 Tax=Flavobacterium jumunjinense TaxID=998845 RepID=A0ABV5GMS3_9FLAO|nr:MULTISPECIES: adenylate kinase [Flavobacterium]